MQDLKKLSDRELLEAVFSNQVIISRMLMRIENYLGKDDTKAYYENSNMVHLNAVDNKLKELREEHKRQFIEERYNAKKTED